MLKSAKPAPVAPYKVLLVDDHTLFRKGVKRLLDDELGQFLVAEAGSAQEAISRLREGHYDLMFLDLNLPGRSGLELLTALRQEPDAPAVIVLSMHKAEQYALTAIRAGARGYLSKDMDCDELLGAARTVLQGRIHVPAEVSSQVFMALSATDSQPLHFALSPREFQIMMGIIEGRSLTTIGNDMLLSVKTVSTYRGRILAKLQLGSNAELVSYAMRHGLMA